MKSNFIADWKVSVVLATVTMTLSSTAFAWTATFLGGGVWAITCANGTSSSYTGSSAGLDVVGPAACPGGMVVNKPNRQLPSGVTAGISASFNRDVVLNKKEVGEVIGPAGARPAGVSQPSGTAVQK